MTRTRRTLVRSAFIVAALAGSVPLWPWAQSADAAPSIEEVLSLRCSTSAGRPVQRRLAPTSALAAAIGAPPASAARASAR